MSADNDARLDALEMTVAHQEQEIQELSDVVKRQWAEIDRLKREIERLEVTKAERPGDDGPEKPPHY